MALKDLFFTIFAQDSGRTGYARGTLAVRHGLAPPVPALDPRPLLTMDDMGHGGMDHGGHAAMGHGAPAAPAAMDHSAHAGHAGHAGLAGMDHSAHAGHAAGAADAHSGPIWRQVLAVLYAYGAFLAVLAVAIPLRMRLMTRWQRS